jgi:peptide/nickel transport system substrate-binding protein
VRTTRRSFLRTAAIIGFGALGTSLLAACRPAAPREKPTTGTDRAESKSPSAAKRTAATAAVNTHALTGTGSGGTLRIGMSASNVPIPDTPPTEGGEGRRFVGTQIYEGLTRFDTHQAEKFCTPVPGMAESWTISDDKLTWTFKLRQGQKFHDGTPFNAEAVKFGFDRILDKSFAFYNPTLATANQQYVAGFDGYNVVDDSTFKIVTKRPYAFLAWDLAYLFFPSPTAVKTYGNKDYVQYASGTGPFRMTKYVDGQVMELAPNEGYWQGKPKLDKLVLLPMPEPASRLAGLQSGTIDWAEVPPPNAVSQLKETGFQVITGPYPHIITYQLNMDKAPFNDVRVRQAINYAVNREATIAVIDGFGIPAGQ